MNRFFGYCKVKRDKSRANSKKLKVLPLVLSLPTTLLQTSPVKLPEAIFKTSNEAVVQVPMEARQITRLQTRLVGTVTLLLQKRQFSAFAHFLITAKNNKYSKIRSHNILIHGVLLRISSIYSMKIEQDSI
jgi:hypothetical protein